MGVDVTPTSLAFSDLSWTVFPGQGVLSRQLTDMRAGLSLPEKEI